MSAPLVAVGAVVLVVLAGLLRRGRFSLFGPVFYYELVRTARRGRFFLLRFAYVGLLLLALAGLYSQTFGVGNGFGGGWTGGQLKVSELAAFAESFFTLVVGMEFLIVFLLTPAYTAAGVAEEKEHQTLDYLLSTDLTGCEIVLGKLAARLANILLLVLAGLPALSLLPLLGGVDPDIVAASFLALVATLVSLGALSTLNSIYCTRCRDAVFLTYVQVVGYLFLSGAASLSPSAFWFSSTNLLVILGGSAASNGPAWTLPALLVRYAVIQGVFGVLCAVWAAVRLRVVTRRQGDRAVETLRPMFDFRKGAVAISLPVLHPPVGDRPVLWKELHTGRRMIRRGAPEAVLALLIALAVILGMGTFFLSLLFAGAAHGFINLWVRLFGTALASLMLVGIGFSAAGRISQERERQTLDSLLTTPLDRRTILQEKWLGSIRSVVPGFLPLGAIWILGVLTGGLGFLAPLFLLVAWLVYADFVATLGLWFSLASRTTPRAVCWTLLAALAVTLAPWLLTLSSNPLINHHRLAGSPPVVLWLLAYYEGDFAVSWGTRDTWEQLPTITVALGCYFGVARLLYELAAARLSRPR